MKSYFRDDIFRLYLDELFNIGKDAVFNKFNIYTEIVFFYFLLQNAYVLSADDHVLN